ncbi:Hint domain-containing protein [Methylobacterium sp. SyP6R]|uniref:Hint domain-containing protein n=1 Tax=Methylobacterium sp. SyP6R TaxID=2718876 RepID=UPI003FA52A21
MIFDGSTSPPTSTFTQAQSADIAANPVAVCFVTGSRISTARGDVAVEDLWVGDLAVTVSGALRPVTWIGHRHLDGRGRTLPHDQQPVRIRAGAFGPGLPARDLRLSPGHPVLVGADADGAGGHLVPIMCLINGTSIAREAVSSVTYWHVELDAHDILLADGLSAESYLDWGDRPFFTEASDHALHNPDFVVPGLAARCRPVAVDGPVVEAERRRLSGVFAASLGAACAWDDAERFAWLAA